MNQVGNLCIPVTFEVDYLSISNIKSDNKCEALDSDLNDLVDLHFGDLIKKGDTLYEGYTLPLSILKK